MARGSKQKAHLSLRDFTKKRREVCHALGSQPSWLRPSKARVSRLLLVFVWPFASDTESLF